MVVPNVILQGVKLTVVGRFAYRSSCLNKGDSTKVEVNTRFPGPEHVWRRSDVSRNLKVLQCAHFCCVVARRSLCAKVVRRLEVFNFRRLYSIGGIG